jgi:hypothetical protein
MGVCAMVPESKMSSNSFISTTERKGARRNRTAVGLRQIWTVAQVLVDQNRGAGGWLRLSIQVLLVAP